MSVCRYEEGEVAGGGLERAHPPSPDSGDSWMAYSSTSSESWRGEGEVAPPPDSGKRPRSEAAEPAPGFPRLSLPTLALPAAATDERVDIRMIDFAHTAYASAAADSPLATATPHHGPDCGFLTGVDSLKRLLTEILAPPPYS